MSEIFFFNKKFRFYKIFICFNPVFFCFFVYLTNYVNYNDLFESTVYIDIAKNWIADPTAVFIPERLPNYPLFILVVFKLFGVDNFNALLFCQSILGFFSFYFVIKTLERLNLSDSIIVLATIALNFSLLFRFSVFLPNALYIFFTSVFTYLFTIFYQTKKIRYFLLLCVFYSLLLLTRPIFHLSIFLTLPLIVLFLIKLEFKKIVKISLIFTLISAYFLGIGIQTKRYLNYDGSFSYSTQSGNQLIQWVIPCLSKKYACGSRNMDVFWDLNNKYEKKINNINLPTEEKKNRLKIQIGIDYILYEMNKIDLLISVIFSYLKVLFHTSIIEIYGAFELHSKEIYASGEDNFLKKILDIFNNSFNDPKNLFWIFSILGVLFCRVFQVIGILSYINNNPLRLYYLTILSMVFCMIIVAVGLGNPRLRSESEILLIILGAAGIEKINTFFKKK